MPLIRALARQKQADLCEEETSRVYRANSRIGSIVTEKICLKKTKTKNKQKKGKFWKKMVSGCTSAEQIHLIL